MRFNEPWLVAPLLSLLLGALAISGLHESTAQQSGGMEALSLDMDPAGNTATSLGNRQECLEALPGDVLTVDVTATNIPPGFPMIAYSYRLLFDGPTIAITSQEPLMILANPGSSLLNVSDPLPDFDGIFAADVIDTGGSPGSAESGSGVLDRLTIEIAADAAPATYQLQLTNAAHIAEDGGAYEPVTIKDSRIAVGVSCSSSTPIPPRPPDGGDGGGPTPPGTVVTPTASAPTDPVPPPSAATTAPEDSPTVTPTPTDAPSTTVATPSPGSSGDADSSTTIIAVIGVILAGLIAAGAAGWFAYRRFTRD